MLTAPAKHDRGLSFTLGQCLPVIAALALMPAAAYGQTRGSAFVEAGPLAEYNSSPFGLDGLGGHVELGIYLSPTWHVGVSAETVKEHYNDSSWSAYSVNAGATVPVTRRLDLELLGGVGRFRATENRLRDQGPAATLGGGAVIAISRHVAIVPQLRGIITFEREDIGAISTFGVGVRWRR